MSHKEIPEEKLTHQLWAVSKSCGMNPPMPPHMRDDDDPDEDNPFLGLIIGLAISIAIAGISLGLAYLIFA